MTLYAGSSGFSYPSWRGGFYPKRARPADFLELYASELNAVELNNPFYRRPAPEQLAAWAAQTPPGFRFAVKAHRGLSHGCRPDLLPEFSQLMRALGDRLGPILVQLPEGRAYDADLLRRFLEARDPTMAYAFQFKNESWLTDAVDATLLEAGSTRVGLIDAAAPFLYLRLREPPYDDAALAELARHLAPHAAERDVFCFFKHEDEPTAPTYAATLISLV